MIKTLQDGLYNWLTIYTIAQHRKEDYAAQETFQQFDTLLKEDFKVEVLEILRNEEEECYLIVYKVDGTRKQSRFPIEAIDCFLSQIEEKPERYRNYM